MEKFQTFRRGKVVLFYTFFWALMIIILAACQKDLLNPSFHAKAINIQEDIESNKTWFENYQKSNVINNSSKFKNAQPQWEHAIAVGNAVEVPIMIDGQFNTPSLYNNLTHLGQQRLVIYNQKNNSKMAYILDYMPSETFTENLKDVNTINFRDKKFDGMIVAYTLNNENIGGYLWNNGKLTKKAVLQSGQIALRSCTISTYLYACGSVLNGPIQCSVGYRITCYEETIENPDDQGGPSSCAYTPWLPECDGGIGGGGGDTREPPCSCTKQSDKIDLFDFIWGVAIKEHDYVSLILSGMDCKTGSSTKSVVHDLKSKYPSTLTHNDVAVEWWTTPIWPDKPDCGKNVTFYTHTEVTLSSYAPGNQNIPQFQSAEKYVSRNFD